MSATFIDDKYIYSIDMIYAYINIFKFESENINIDKLIFNLDFTCWKNKLKPNTVLDNMSNDKYKVYINQIKNENLDLPIIINEHNIVIDGMYKLAHAKMKNKKTIKVYVIDNLLMKKFKILKNNQIDKINSIKICDYIEIFVNNIIMSKIDENKHYIKMIINKKDH